MWVIYTDDNPLAFSTNDLEPDIELPLKKFEMEYTNDLEGKMVDIINFCLIDIPPDYPFPDPPADEPEE